VETHPKQSTDNVSGSIRNDTKEHGTKRNKFNLLMPLMTQIFRHNFCSFIFFLTLVSFLFLTLVSVFCLDSCIFSLPNSFLVDETNALIGPIFVSFNSNQTLIRHSQINCTFKRMLGIFRNHSVSIGVRE